MKLGIRNLGFLLRRGAELFFDLINAVCGGKRSVWMLSCATSAPGGRWIWNTALKIMTTNIIMSPDCAFPKIAVVGVCALLRLILHWFYSSYTLIYFLCSQTRFFLYKSLKILPVHLQGSKSFQVQKPPDFWLQVVLKHLRTAMARKSGTQRITESLRLEKNSKTIELKWSLLNKVGLEPRYSLQTPQFYLHQWGGGQSSPHGIHPSLPFCFAQHQLHLHIFKS